MMSFGPKDANDGPPAPAAAAAAAIAVVGGEVPNNSLPGSGYPTKIDHKDEIKKFSNYLNCNRTSGKRQLFKGQPEL